MGVRNIVLREKQEQKAGLCQCSCTQHAQMQSFTKLPVIVKFQNNYDFPEALNKPISEYAGIITNQNSDPLCFR